MTSKVPSAEEVLALVTAATNGADVTSEPTMQQLLMQVQAQQVHLQMHAQAQTHADVHAAHAQMQAAVAVAMNAAQGAGGHEDHTVSIDAGTTPMDLMPLSAAAVVIASPTNGDGSSGRAGHGTSASIRRKSIPLSMKKEAIEWIMGPGKGVPSRAEKHFSALNWDVSASSFRKWWKNRDKIMNDSSSKKRISGGGRKPYLEESEEKLLVIVIQERAKKDRVTRKWIAKTAQHMFQRTNANFKASENWVTKFIRRNGLTLKRSYVTYDHPDQPGVDGSLSDQTMGVTAGGIEVHDDDDDDDDEDSHDTVKNAADTIVV
ncbi:hypothetical protein Poli38472_001013 [Pythium oligandrum]|uniref:HTH CENPB-type domain-containing protein n=1 Tax=Pythium oligandrum TaxID=41045 RepID=A0A8K1CS53_PYTOL|nr:hypothetical protein Poli38472_001013 [Pythium oligandrum]|eukprot:TMW68857.1 hypothetical protein Poli38472_001013 [Pythium oligandrum]